MKTPAIALAFLLAAVAIFLAAPAEAAAKILGVAERRNAGLKATPISPDKTELVIVAQVVRKLKRARK